LEEIWISYIKSCYWMALIIGFIIYYWGYRDFPERIKMQIVIFFVVVSLISFFIFDKIYVSRVLTEKINQGEFRYGEMQYLYGESYISTRGGSTGGYYVYYYNVDGVVTKMFFANKSPIIEKWPKIESEISEGKVYRIKYVNFTFLFYQKNKVYDVLN